MMILIPSYEPDGTLLGLIQDIHSCCAAGILLVDDGSGAVYAPIFQMAETLGCVVMHHEKNMGKGAALKTGFQYLIRTGEKEGVVCADCDGQHAAADIRRIADETLRHSSTAILGSRRFNTLVPLRSRIGNTITRGVFHMNSGYRLQDTQTGLRGYPAAMLPWLCGIRGSRFEYELNVLLVLKPAGYNIREIEIRTIYGEGNNRSHFRTFTDSVLVYLPFLKFSASSLTSGLLDFILLLIFSRVCGNLLTAVILSRMISSVCNYGCNKYLIFDNRRQSNLQSAPRYFGLVAVILLLNYILLKTLVLAGLSLVFAKLFTECVLFLMSYEVQKHIVFAKTHAKPHAS